MTIGLDGAIHWNLVGFTHDFIYGLCYITFFFFFTFVYVCPQRPEGALYESLVFQVSASRLMWVLRSEVDPLVEQ